jgi:hypothetical protein
VAAELVFLGWFLGQFLLDPALCEGPGCEAMRAALHLSVISAIVGIGCVIMLAGHHAFTLRIPPTLLLVVAMGAFAIAAVTSVRAGLIILPLFDVALMLVPAGLLLGNEITRRGTEHQNTRREYLTWVLVGLAIVIAFAVIISLIVLK